MLPMPRRHAFWRCALAGEPCVPRMATMRGSLLLRAARRGLIFPWRAALRAPTQEPPMFEAPRALAVVATEFVDDMPRRHTLGPFPVAADDLFANDANAAAKAACEADNAKRFGPLAPALVWRVEGHKLVGRWPEADAHDDSMVWRIRVVAR